MGQRPPLPMPMRRVLGAVAALLLALATVGYAYAVAGWIGARIAANPQWTVPAQGVQVVVEDNGVHTGIVLPKRLLPPRLLARLSPGDLRDPRHARHDHVAIGWGERSFYLDTPTWADLDLRTVLAAGLGSNATLMHVEHVARPVAGKGVGAITLRPAEVARLVAFIDAGFADRPGGAIPGYGAHDAFYPATGRYDAVRTCNEWTGRAFRHAGVMIGAWTPFSGGVMRWLEPLQTG